MLVSCLMPTADRPARARQAIQDFLNQDYPERELIILDDGEPAITAPRDPRVRLVRHTKRQILGWKREALVGLAQGDVLVTWDDDDWHGPQRISVQLGPIREGKEGSVFGGIRSYDESSGTFWETPVAQWLAPGTLAFTRRYHGRGAYPDVDVGADSRFIKSRPRNLVAVIDGREHYVMVRHDSHRTSHSYVGWRQLPSERVGELDVQERYRARSVGSVDVHHR
jgi:glycosyltransferase involved in cell wall biosynthesis